MRNNFFDVCNKKSVYPHYSEWNGWHYDKTFSCFVLYKKGKAIAVFNFI